MNYEAGKRKSPNSLRKTLRSSLRCAINSDYMNVSSFITLENTRQGGY